MHYQTLSTPESSFMRFFESMHGRAQEMANSPVVFHHGGPLTVFRREQVPSADWPVMANKYRAGRVIHAIAREHGTSYSVVRKILLKQGVQMRPACKQKAAA
jgi:hypothetical protein